MQRNPGPVLLLSFEILATGLSHISHSVFGDHAAYAYRDSQFTEKHPLHTFHRRLPWSWLKRQQLHHSKQTW